SYLSTGNFHEDTAKVYSDFGLFTADERIVGEVTRIFSYLETVKPPAHAFEHLFVGQFNLRPALEALIDYETAAAKAGREASIILKMNSIEDIPMMDRLYKASQAGVSIKLIIRGICCLVPGLQGWSENIEVISIVDRYLEHARVFIFHHDGADKIYLSSADWMVRNLTYRVETAFPVYDERLKRQLKDLIAIQLNDNVKARVIDYDQSNSYRKDDSDLAIRSQLETYYYLKRKTDGH
ncbi:MAG: polyphosphate kinase 1, partial [Saprospiraceae bacterium]|nr:polyphosphate kinase 1 [Saprospiraceae bacterium]